MITFVGHVSKDVNVVRGFENIVPGGGAFYGAFAARSLGETVKVVTKVSKGDLELFEEMEGFGIEVVFLSSKETTSIRNVYPSENPDERKSTVVSTADPFTEDDLEYVEGDTVHITPLWYGEFPEELIPVVREKTEVLSGDAQGFLRHVENGEMVYRTWEKIEYLKYFDVFKLDAKEAKVLTEYDDPERVFEYLSRFGVREIVLTRSDGVFVHRNGKTEFARFGSWTLEGRTGRGDTCIGAYLALKGKMEDLKDLVKEVASITTKKMQRPGPYRGW